MHVCISRHMRVQRTISHARRIPNVLTYRCTTHTGLSMHRHANSTKSYSHASLEAHAQRMLKPQSLASCCGCCAAAGDIPRQKKLKSVRGCIASWLPPSAVTAATAADAVAHAGRRVQQPLNGPLRWVRRCARPSCELQPALWSALPRRGA